MKVHMNLKTSGGKDVFMWCEIPPVSDVNKIRIHFIDDRDHHISGFNLLSLSKYGLNLITDIGLSDIEIKKMDIDSNKRNILKVIGVDIIE